MRDDTPPQTPEWAEHLNIKLTRLNKKIELQNQLLAFGNLGPDRIVDISHRGDPFRIYVPFGDRDYIQRHIIATRDFYEAQHLNVLREMGVVPKGKVIIDAGANIGNHTVFMGHYFAPSRVYAFEPQKSVFQTLERNIDLNLDGLDVRAVNALLGAEKGSGDVARYNQNNIGATSFEQKEDGGTPMVTLDDSLLKKDIKDVGFIKMDVEGFQVEALRGAHEILSKSKPVLWIEVFAQERAATDEILAPYGYEGTELFKSNVIYRVPDA